MVSYDDILKIIREELSDDERQRLADELKKSCNEVQTDQSIYDSMSKRGLIGKLTNAPTDLSTNPIHMEGFGQDAQ